MKCMLWLLAFVSFNGFVMGQTDTAGIKILCYNIHHANPPSQKDSIDINAIAAVIRQQRPQLVALQELDVFTARSGKSLHQARELAALTGMHYYFAKAIDYGGGEYGVGILSVYPIGAPQTFPLPTVAGTNGEPRVLATAEIVLPGNRKILFACTHLDAQRSDTNRLQQINAIAGRLKNSPLPVIIAGDFNAEPASPVIDILDQHFRRTCMEQCGFTIPVNVPVKTIDFIAYAPASAFSVQSHYVVQEHYASDHLPVVSVLKLR